MLGYCAGDSCSGPLPWIREVFNLGGGSRTTLSEVIGMLEAVSGRKAKLKKLGRQQGDVRHTEAEIIRAKEKLGFAPRVALLDGLAQEWEWVRKMRDK